MSLTKKQKSFVEEYLIDLNATQAALRAGYSEKTAKQMGTENLAKPVLKKAIEERLEKRSEATSINAEYVLKRHKEIDDMDIQDIFLDDLSGFKPLSEWPKVWRTTISGLDIAEMFEYNDGKKELSGLIKKIKWPDKVRNLELLGKHTDIGAYAEQIKTEDITPPKIEYVVPSEDTADTSTA